MADTNLQYENECRECRELEKENDELKTVLSAAMNALRSYQYGNSSPELAESVADKIQSTLKR